MLHHREEKTFWLTAGVSSIRQHVDNIALNVGKSRGRHAENVNIKGVFVQAEPLQTAVMDVQQI